MSFSFLFSVPTEPIFSDGQSLTVGDTSHYESMIQRETVPDLPSPPPGWCDTAVASKSFVKKNKKSSVSFDGVLSIGSAQSKTSKSAQSKCDNRLWYLFIFFF